MNNLNFKVLNNNQMNSIKGGIIVEHLRSYDGLLSNAILGDVDKKDLENNEVVDENIFTSKLIIEKGINEEN